MEERADPMLLPKTERHRSPRHLAWIRTLPCSVPGCNNGSIHAHHVRKGAGVGIKPSDAYCLPLCAEHHHEGHQTGWRSFEVRHGLDLATIAARLWAESDHPPSHKGSTPMSDTTQTDPALEMLREQISQLALEISLHKQRAETATAIHDRFLAMEAALTRKLRPRNTRTPRVVETNKPAANDTNDMPRPTVFALPANDPVGEAEAA